MNTTLIHHTNTDMKRNLLLATAIVVIGMFLPIDTARSNEYSNEAVLLARLCFNEASFNEIDCAAIGAIRMRGARRSGRSFGEELIAQHGQRSLRPDRATNPRADDTRPWIGDLNAAGEAPVGWNVAFDWIHARPRWMKLLSTAQRVADGRLSDPCVSPPVTWGGPRVDAHHIVRLTQDGSMVPVACGRTHNVFLARAR